MWRAIRIASWFGVGSQCAELDFQGVQVAENSIVVCSILVIFIEDIPPFLGAKGKILFDSIDQRYTIRYAIALCAFRTARSSLSWWERGLLSCRCVGMSQYLIGS